MITLDDYFMGRDKSYLDELTEALCGNAAVTIERANQLLLRAGMQRGVNSGWRPSAVNAAIRNAGRESKHIHCLAIDLNDDDDSLDAWCMANLEVLAEIGLWLEHPDCTPRWCHVQTIAPVSGRRVFFP